MATRLELCTSASSASGATADEAAAEGILAAERVGARRVDTRLELCTRGSSTIPSCAPASARTTGTARRAREGRLSRIGKEERGGRARQAVSSSSSGGAHHHHRSRRRRGSEGETRGGTNLRRGPRARARVEGSARANAWVIACVLIRGVGESRSDPALGGGRHRHRGRTASVTVDASSPRRGRAEIAKSRREPRIISRPFADSLEPAEARIPFKFDRYYR